MQLVDVNVLVYAHRADAPDHERYRTWLDQWIEADTAFGVTDIVLSNLKSRLLGDDPDRKELLALAERLLEETQ